MGVGGLGLFWSEFVSSQIWCYLIGREGKGVLGGPKIKVAQNDLCCFLEFLKSEFFCKWPHATKQPYYQTTSECMRVQECGRVQEHKGTQETFCAPPPLSPKSSNNFDNWWLVELPKQLVWLRMNVWDFWRFILALFVKYRKVMHECHHPWMWNVVPLSHLCGIFILPNTWMKG